MTQLISKLVANKHTSGAALAYLAIELGQQIACSWFPEHADKIYETARQLSKGVVGYGLIMAGDAKGTPPKDDHLTPQQQLTVPIQESKQETK